MRQPTDLRRPPVTGVPPLNSTRRGRCRSSGILLLVLAMALLACNLIGPGPQPDAKRTARTRLPTFTPTSRLSPVKAGVGAAMPAGKAPTAAPPVAATSPPLPVSTATSTFVSLPDEPPTSTALARLARVRAMPAISGSSTLSTPLVPTATPPPELLGWSFAGVQTYPGPDGEGLLLYGDLVNETGLAQELAFVSATFYDEQDQVVADPGNIIDYWPIDLIPPGGRLPFELTALDITQAARYNLTLEAQSGSWTLQQNFEFSDIEQWRRHELLLEWNSQPRHPLARIRGDHGGVV